MVRKYSRLTDRLVYPDDYLLDAVNKVIIDKCKVARVSKEMSIPRRSLRGDWSIPGHRVKRDSREKNSRF